MSLQRLYFKREFEVVINIWFLGCACIFSLNNGTFGGRYFGRVRNGPAFLLTSAIIVHFDLWNKKRGLTLKVHAFFIWKAIQYIGMYLVWNLWYLQQSTKLYNTAMKRQYSRHWNFEDYLKLVADFYCTINSAWVHIFLCIAVYPFVFRISHSKLIVDTLCHNL